MPTLIAWNLTPASTGTGVTPYTPPQQYALPRVVSPHVLNTPALTTANVRVPTTAVGVVLPVVEPLPSCPYELLPQQYAAPSVVTPQLEEWPALTEANTKRVTGAVHARAKGTSAIAPAATFTWTGFEPRTVQFAATPSSRTTWSPGGKPEMAMVPFVPMARL